MIDDRSASQLRKIHPIIWEIRPRCFVIKSTIDNSWHVTINIMHHRPKLPDGIGVEGVESGPGCLEKPRHPYQISSESLPRLSGAGTLYAGESRVSRTITVRPQAEHAVLQQTRERQQTPEWKRSYDRRAGIEGTLSQGIRAFELRQARYRGQAKTHLHHMITAVAMNIVRIMAWLQGRPYAPTRQSPFAALRPAG